MSEEAVCFTCFVMMASAAAEKPPCLMTVCELTFFSLVSTEDLCVIRLVVSSPAGDLSDSVARFFGDLINLTSFDRNCGGWYFCAGLLSSLMDSSAFCRIWLEVAIRLPGPCTWKYFYSSACSCRKLAIPRFPSSMRLKALSCDSEKRPLPTNERALFARFSDTLTSLTRG